MKAERQPTVFTAKMKLADVITADRRVLSVLARLGISLGFGDASVDDVCRERGLSARLLLTIINTAAPSGYRPDVTALTGADIKRVADYLAASHRYFRQVMLAELHTNIHRLLATCDERSAAVLNKFYDDYESEVNAHFDFEEEQVFPYVKKLAEGHRCDRAYDDSQFAENHDNISDALADLRNILLKYLPDTGAELLRIEVINRIFDIGEELRRHTVVENAILIPWVKRNEASK